MSDLIAVGFKGEDTADHVLNTLQALQKEYLIDLADSCVVVRDQTGQVHLKQAVNLTRRGGDDRRAPRRHVGHPDRPAVPQPDARHGGRRGRGGRIWRPGREAVGLRH
jgi:hypothetical protein